MYIPSGFLFKLITSEKIGVFCESNPFGDKAIIAKLPTSTIKAIALGAKIEFYLFTTSKKPFYLALCMKIYDNKSSPLYALLTQRWNDSNNIFDVSFLDSELNLSLFDETDAPIQESIIKIKTNFKNSRVKFVLKNTKFISSDDYIEANNFMDSICADLGLVHEAHPHYPIVSFKFPVEVKNTRTIKTHHVNEQGSTSYDVVQDIDGARQERQIYQSLCLMENSKTFISPLVTIGKKERELTDVLTITQNRQLIAIESKCLQVDETTVDKSHDRTSASIIKHCKKALGQLEGVYKTLKRGDRVYDESNNTLTPNETFSFYGVVLIDEFRPSKGWSEVISIIRELSNLHNICLNVISISEIIYTMKLCASNMDLFIKSLENRHKACIEEGNIDIRFINTSLPTIIK